VSRVIGRKWCCTRQKIALKECRCRAFSLRSFSYVPHQLLLRHQQLSKFRPYALERLAIHRYVSLLSRMFYLICMHSPRDEPRKRECARTSKRTCHVSFRSASGRHSEAKVWLNCSGDHAILLPAIDSRASRVPVRDRTGQSVHVAPSLARRPSRACQIKGCCSEAHMRRASWRSCLDTFRS